MLVLVILVLAASVFSACSGGNAENDLNQFRQLDSTTTPPLRSRQASGQFDAAVAGTAGPAADEGKPILHVLGSIRAVQNASADWQDDVPIVLDDLVTITSLGCDPTTPECGPSAILDWSVGGVDLLNVATADAALAGSNLGEVIAQIRVGGVEVVGYGEDLVSATSGITVTSGGLTVSIHALSLTANEESWATEDAPGIAGANSFDTLLETIQERRQLGAAIVVLVDSGELDDRAPTPQQVIDLERLVAIEVEAIIGHGSDFVQRFDRVGNSTVVYNLGNSVTPTDDPLRTDSALLRLEFATSGRACLLPTTAGPDGLALDDPAIRSCAE